MAGKEPIELYVIVKEVIGGHLLTDLAVLHFKCLLL